MIPNEVRRVRNPGDGRISYSCRVRSDGLRSNVLLSAGETLALTVLESIRLERYRRGACVTGVKPPVELEIVSKAV